MYLWSPSEEDGVAAAALVRRMRKLAVYVLPALVAACGDGPTQASMEETPLPAESYHNPVDGQTYVAPGGWKTYQPAVPRADEPGRNVTIQHVRLLVSEADLAARADVSDVAAFLREAARLADVSFGNSGRQFRVLVQFTCKPSGHEVKLAHQGNVTQELLQSYHDALVAAKKLRVRAGEVSFQMELSVSP